MQTRWFHRLLLLGVVVGSGIAQADIQVIALRDDPVPGGNGVYMTLEPPVINFAGDVAFRATLDETTGGLNDNRGIWRTVDGSLLEVARRGQPTPLGTGNYSTFSEVALAESGDVYFRATVAGFFSDGNFRSTIAGTAHQIAANGDPVPGQSGTLVSLTAPVPGVADLAAFRASVSGGQAIIRNIAEVGNSVLVRSGDPAPGGGNFQANMSRPALNTAGHIAFGSSFLVAVPFQLGAGIFIADGDSIEPVVRSGTSVPDGNGLFSSSGLTATPALSSSGEAAFTAFDLSATAGGSLDNAGIYRGDARSVTEIARRGAATPSGNGLFLQFAASVAVNAKQQVLFISSLAGTSAGNSNDSGIFIGDGTEIIEIVREGDLAPGGRSTFSQFQINVPTAIDLNDDGVVVFLAELANNDEILARWDAETGVTAIAQSGDRLLDGTIQSLDFNGVFSPLAEESRGLNGAGVVGFKFTLSPGNRHGIARWTPTGGRGPLADINDDGVVDGADLAIVLGTWGTSGEADLNGDGTVDGADLAIVLGGWAP